MPKRLKITILSDDRAARGLEARHGLSILVEADGRKMLLDAGQKGEAAANAQALGIDLAQVEAVVLSHGHYDHCGGLLKILKAAPGATIYCHRRALDERYSQQKGQAAREVGMPPLVREHLLALGRQKFKRPCHSRQMLPGVWTTGAVARRSPFEQPEDCFTLDREGKAPDPIIDDQGLWIETPRGLVVVTGCAHAGIVNTVRQAIKFSVRHRLLAVVGGFHLGSAGSERLERTAQGLKALKPGLVVSCHCTGQEAEARLEKALGKAFRRGYAGLRLEL